MKKGFTLSEVLITLGIIGVIAVLTIPAVMKNYRNRLYVSQLEKVYAQIATASQAIMNDEHTAHFYETTAAKATSCSNATKGECEAGAGYFLNNYFKPLKRNCGPGKANSCAADTYTSINGTTVGKLAGDYCIQTTNGAAICMEYNATDKLSHINVDVNGPSAPNMTGRDVFYMTIQDTGLITDYKNSDPSKCSNPTSEGCLNKVMQAGWKMEY